MSGLCREFASNIQPHASQDNHNQNGTSDPTGDTLKSEKAATPAAPSMRSEFSADG
jgi:hypothetical protein